MRIYALHRSEDKIASINPVLSKTIKPHPTPVITVAVDDTGTLLATGSADGIVKVWDIRGGYVTHTFRGHDGIVSALHFFQATLEQDPPKERANRKKRSRSDLAEDVVMVDGHDSAVAFRLASGSEDGRIRIWDLAKRRAIATLGTHVSVIRSFDYIRSINALVSGSRDKTAQVWDAQTWRTRRVVPILESVEAVGFLEEGRFFYSGGSTGRLRLWDVESGQEVTEGQEVQGEGDAIVHILTNANQGFLVSVHADQSFMFHNTTPLSVFTPSAGSVGPLPILRRVSGTHDEIIDLAFLTPHRSLLALAANTEDVRIVSLSASETETSSAASASYFGADVALLRGHEDIIICLSCDWSGHWLATGAKDNTARLWRIDHASKSYKSYATFTGHAESIGAVALPSNPPPIGSPGYTNPLDHPPAFLITGSQDRTIKCWSIPESSSSSSSILSLDNSLQARALYTRKAHDKDINAICTSPNSTLFASASQDRNVKIWSTEEGEVQGILRGHRRGVWSVSFAPKDYPSISGDNGPTSSSRGLVLTGSGDKTIKIWSLNDYSCIRTLEGHTNSVLKVLWLPLSNSSAPTTTNSKATPPQIASAGGDGLVKIWDAATGEVAATLDNHTDRIWALAVDPDTRMLVSGGGDSVVTFWKDTSSETAGKTRAAATQRVEQDQELQNHIHQANYREAITLALALNHPARLLSLLQAVLNTSPPEEGSITGLKVVDEVLSSLSDEQILSLLSRVRDWNTNARTSTVAQRVLNVVVKSYSAERLAGLGRRKGGREVVEALRVYTERHYRRVEELCGDSWIVEFLLNEMDQLVINERGLLDGEKDVIMV